MQSMWTLSTRLKRRPITPETVAQKRDRFEALARQHQALLMRIARKMAGRDDARAQDYVQDTLVRGYEAYLDGSYEEGTNAKAWLVRILTNVFLNDNRRRRRRESGLDLDCEAADHTDLLMASPGEQPDALLLHGTLDGPIEAALASLPEHQRLCVILVDVEELDYAEAAAALGVPVGTVRSRLARARMALHEKLVDYGRTRGY
jgi:RNA polymerase sigma-70 factor, ECF subfamily